MTVETTSGGGAVAPWVDDNVGLEDITAEDLTIPRLKIAHVDGVFKDTLSGAEFPTLDVIFLGLVKQRIMWDGDIEDGDRPQCKSPDFEHGFPNISGSGRAETQFPWGDSNFEPSNAIQLVLSPTQSHPEGFNTNGNLALPCNSCIFTQWGKSANGKSIPPRCSEQHTFPLLYTPDNGETWMTALLTLQKSGITPSKRYLSSFAQSKTPLFSTVTRIGLNQERKGMVTYCTPTFQKGAATHQSAWPEYAEQARSIRSFIRSAPRGQEVDGAVPTGDDPWAAEANAAPVAAPAPPAPAPAAPPAPPAPAPAAAAPVTAPPAVVAPAPPAPPAAPPVAPVAPVAATAPPVAPPAAPPAPVPASPSTPAIVAPADAIEDDDIPF